LVKILEVNPIKLNINRNITTQEATVDSPIIFKVKSKTFNVVSAPTK
jgi:hypothetical protein